MSRAPSSTLPSFSIGPPMTTVGLGMVLVLTYALYTLTGQQV
jgi:hypothetical protein